MKMKQNVKEAFETISIGALCAVFVISMHQSCSGISEKISEKKSGNNTEIKKVQELKNDTIKTFKLEQRVR